MQQQCLLRQYFQISNSENDILIAKMYNNILFFIFFCLIVNLLMTTVNADCKKEVIQHDHETVTAYFCND